MLDPSLAVNFFIERKPGQFAFRRMYHAPREGDLCVFNDVRYKVLRIEWCLDTDATEVGTRVNIELRKL